MVQNDTSVSLSRVQVRVIKYNAAGRAIAQSQPLLISGGVAPGKRSQVSVGEHVATPQEANLYKVVVETAEIAQ